MQEVGPVIRRDLIQRVDQIVEGIGLQLRPVVRAAVEEVAEIVERLLAVRPVVDDRRDLEPDEIAFVVVVGAAAPIQPAATPAAHRLANRRVEERTPRAARASRPDRPRRRPGSRDIPPASTIRCGRRATSPRSRSALRTPRAVGLPRLSS